MGEVPEHPWDDHRIRPLQVVAKKWLRPICAKKQAKRLGLGHRAVQGPHLAELNIEA